MNGMEFLAEAMEQVENTELSELLGKKEHLQSQLEAAQEAGNMEKVNFLNGELAKLTEQMEQKAGTAGGTGEISFGSREGHSYGHSESYWKEKAAEAALKGQASSRDLFLKRAAEARANRES